MVFKMNFYKILSFVNFAITSTRHLKNDFNCSSDYRARPFFGSGNRCKLRPLCHDSVDARMQMNAISPNETHGNFLPLFCRDHFPFLDMTESEMLREIVHSRWRFVRNINQENRNSRKKNICPLKHTLTVNRHFSIGLRLIVMYETLKFQLDTHVPVAYWTAQIFA